MSEPVYIMTWNEVIDQAGEWVGTYKVTFYGRPNAWITEVKINHEDKVVELYGN